MNPLCSFLRLSCCEKVISEIQDVPQYAEDFYFLFFKILILLQGGKRVLC